LLVTATTHKDNSDGATRRRSHARKPRVDERLETTRGGSVPEAQTTTTRPPEARGRRKRGVMADRISDLEAIREIASTSGPLFAG